MDHPDQRQQQHQQQQQGMGISPGSNQMLYPSPYQPAPIVVTGSPAMPASSPPTTYPGPQQLTYPQGPQFQSPQQQQQLQAFWANQMQEIERTIDFKNHSLPLARIKKIMKADEDVRMISAEAPVIFAKACDMFVLELTLRSWIHTEENKRRTLQKNDIAAAISRTDVFDFLVDIIPRDELKEEGLGITKAGFPMGSPTDAGLPYYYVPSGGVYAGQHHPPPVALPFMPWSQPPAQQSSSQQQEQQPSE